MKFYALRKNSKAVACGTIILKVLVAMYNLKISAPHYNYILRKICDKVHNVFFYSTCWSDCRGSPSRGFIYFFQNWLTVLILMEDTVILATSRETLIKNHKKAFSILQHGSKWKPNNWPWFLYSQVLSHTPPGLVLPSRHIEHPDLMTGRCGVKHKALTSTPYFSTHQNHDEQNA